MIPIFILRTLGLIESELERDGKLDLVLPPEIAEREESESIELSDNSSISTENQYIKDTKPDVVDKIEESLGELKSLESELNKFLESKDDIKAITDKNQWENLHKYIMDNFPNLVTDGRIGLEFQIRYFMCFYIVMFIPAQFVFFFPSVITKLIPKKSYKLAVIGPLLEELKSFLQFVRVESSNSFIITFFIGRQNSLKEDFEFVLHISDKIMSDPMFIVREILRFQLDAKGYKEFKKNSLKS